jgi:hypothetical protein
MLAALTLYVRTLTHRLGTQEGGFSTAELLGNAALGIAALVIIWAALQGVGVNVVSWIEGQLLR